MGIVEAVGSEMTNLAVGDRVVVPFNISSGHCYMCDKGLQSQCETTQVHAQGNGAALLEDAPRHFNAAETSWDCPCHGSRFGVDGDVLAGPAVDAWSATRRPDRPGGRPRTGCRRPARVRG